MWTAAWSSTNARDIPNMLRKRKSGAPWPSAAPRSKKEEDVPGGTAFPYPYSEFEVHKVTDDGMAPIDITTKGVTVDFKAYVDEPGATIGLEDYRPGDEVDWNYLHDEVHYILKGKGEITYSLPPLHRRWYQTTAEAGCVYLIPRGARLRIKVIGDEPYRHLFVVMPGGFYPQDKLDR